MENHQAFDILNGTTPDLSNENNIYSANEDDDNKILSFDNQGGLNTPSHPQYRPNTSSAGTPTNGSANRVRRNGSMRRSLLFVSGTGMQIPSPTPSNKSPYMNNRLSQSSDVILNSQRRDNLSPSARENISPGGRLRAYSHSNDELHRETEKSPEQTKIHIAESTQHPLIVTKNSNKGANRYITPTPINPTDFPDNKSAASSPIVSEKKHARRASSFSSRSLLMTPNSSSNNVANGSVKKNPDFQNANMFEIKTAENNENENDLSEEFLHNKSVVKDSEQFTSKENPAEKEDPSAMLFSRLATKEAQLLESKSELEELKRKVKAKEDQIKEEESQLEALKQEMAAELLKKHQRVPPQTTSKMSDILGITRKSAQTLVSPITQPNNPTELMETSFSEELKFPSSTHASARKDSFKEFDDKPQSLFDTGDDLDDVVYSLNSPQKKSIETFEPVSQTTTLFEDKEVSDMLDTNFPVREDTMVITPTARHRATQSVSVGQQNRNMPQRSKSRMSMYFSKTVSLMSQFDQILQSELEKKMGVDNDDEKEIKEEEEEEKEEIMDLPPRPDEIDDMPMKSVQKKSHGRSLSSYRFFG